MTWKPIVAGIDRSEEGVRAAQTAIMLAREAKTDCHLVHAVRDPVTEFVYTDIPLNFQELRPMILDSARNQLAEFLREKVPDAVLDRLECRFGSPGLVLKEVAGERDAELVVLGGKHHSAVDRWLAGSTIHHMVRTLDRPILVTGPLDDGEGFSRVMAALDLSHATKPTILAAVRIAELFKAELRAVHVVESVSWVTSLQPTLYDALVRLSEDEFKRSIWPQIRYPNADHLVLRGHVPDSLAGAAVEWKARLLVVGTQGRGWVDRILIGSVTERLLNRLATSMLVIPVPAPAAKVNGSKVAEPEARPATPDTSAARA